MRIACATFALFLLFVPEAVKAEVCKFFDGEIGDLKTDPRFMVSGELKTTIEATLFWANRDFFDEWNRPGCEGAWVTAQVTEKSSGARFRYYRTNKDTCDGGNTYGIIINEGQTTAISYIRDGFLECDRP